MLLIFDTRVVYQLIRAYSRLISDVLIRSNVDYWNTPDLQYQNVGETDICVGSVDRTQ